MSFTYDLVVFLDNEPPYNTAANPPPIANLFDPTLPNTAASHITVNLPPNYLAPPSSDVFCDTRISKDCGKKNCEECCDSGNFKIKPCNADYLLFQEILKIWETGGKTNGIIFVKPSTVSAGNDVALVNQILTEIQPSGGLIDNFDLFYFSKWLDKPEQYDVIKNYNAFGGIKLIRTQSPHGFQAIAFSPSGLSKLEDSFHPDSNPVLCRPFSQILNILVENGTLDAFSTTPPLFSYDALAINNKTQASNLKEKARFSYLKTSEAQGSVHPEEPLNRRVSSDLSLFYFVMLFFIVVVVFITFYEITKHHSLT